MNYIADGQLATSLTAIYTTAGPRTSRSQFRVNVSLFNTSGSTTEATSLTVTQAPRPAAPWGPQHPAGSPPRRWRRASRP